MNNFTIVFQNVFMMLLYLLCGYCLVKVRKGEASHAKSFSSFLIYVCGPCMIISAFQTMQYSVELTAAIVKFFFASLLAQALFMLAVYVLLHRNYEDARYRILTIGAVFGNVGFFGLPLVTALFPENPEVACYSSVYVMSMNLLVFTIGVYMITKKKEYISIKSALLNPTSIAMYLSLPMYFLGIRLPENFGDSVALLGKMTTPICMLVLGMRLAASDLRKVFCRPFAYVVCVLKLVAFPVFSYLCVRMVPFFDSTFCGCMLALSGAPSAAVILSMAEIHECEQELSANVVLLTTIFSVITAPLLLLIV